MNEMRILHESNIFEYNHFRKNTVRLSQKRIHVKICISIHTSNHTQRNVHLVHSFGLFSLSVTYLDTPASG